MRVVLIYRQRVDGANSIEELFDTLSDYLSNKCTIIKYELGNKKNLLTDILKIRSLNADVYHITGDVHYIACFLPKNKTLLTIHDINYFALKLSGIKKLIYKWIYLSLPLRSIAQLTTISFETKNVIQKYFPNYHDITIISNCYNSNLFKYNEHTFNTECPTILQIGTKANKNIPRLLNALSSIRCKLLILGRLNDSIIKSLNEYQIDYENFCNLELNEVYSLYVRSDIVAFISTSEGFGLPIIEGQAVGRSVICSDIQPMSGIAGTGAHLVNPRSIEEIRDGILKIQHDAEYRIKIINDGLHNIRQYHPEEIANKYYLEYIKLYNRNR